MRCHPPTNTGGGTSHLQKQLVASKFNITQNTDNIKYFNPRAPHGARPVAIFSFSRLPHIFQSTRPAWGATARCHVNAVMPADFNPRAPHGARHAFRLRAVARYRISIHAPRMGRDGQPGDIVKEINIFQSTRPAWGATRHSRESRDQDLISIHAPRMGRDRKEVGKWIWC